MDKSYYPKVFLEKCKYIIKEKKISRYINKVLALSSDDSNESGESKEDTDNEKMFMKDVIMLVNLKHVT